MKYRKKPVVVNAWLIQDVVDGFYELEKLDDALERAIEVKRVRPVLNGVYIDTLEGGMFGRLEDYLIMGVQGEFYVCKPDIFAETYEEIAE